MYQADGGTDLVGQGKPNYGTVLVKKWKLGPLTSHCRLNSRHTYGFTSKQISPKEREKKMIIATKRIVTSSLVHHL